MDNTPETPNDAAMAGAANIAIGSEMPGSRRAPPIGENASADRLVDTQADQTEDTREVRDNGSRGGEEAEFGRDRRVEDGEACVDIAGAGVVGDEPNGGDGEDQGRGANGGDGDDQGRRADDSEGSDSEEDDENRREASHGITVAVRASRSSEMRCQKKGGKAGNQGRFAGAMRDCLMEHVDVYLQIEKGQKGKNQELNMFWQNIRSEFWNRFTWEDAKVGMVNDGAGLSQEQVMSATNQSIKTWFRWRNKASNSTSSVNPWNSALKALRSDVPRQPKQKVDWQLWMHQHPQEVDEVYREREPLAQKTGIALRSEIAKDLFSRLSDDQKQSVRQDARAQWLQECEKAKDELAGKPSKDPQDQMDARRRLTRVVTPLLQLICEHTGFTAATLVAGAPPSAATGKHYIVSNVDYGVTNESLPREFAKFDPEGFRSRFLDQFLKFLKYTATDNPIDGEDADTATNTDSGPSVLINKDHTAGEEGQTSEELIEDESEPTRRRSHRGKGKKAATTADNDDQQHAPKAGPSQRPRPMPVLRKDTPDDIAKWLSNLDEKSKAAKVKEWATLTSFDFERECNIIRQGILLTDLGLARNDTFQKRNTGRFRRDRPTGDDDAFVPNHSHQASDSVSPPRSPSPHCTPVSTPSSPPPDSHNATPPPLTSSSQVAPSPPSSNGFEAPPLPPGSETQANATSDSQDSGDQTPSAIPSNLPASTSPAATPGIQQDAWHQSLGHEDWPAWLKDHFRRLADEDMGHTAHEVLWREIFTIWVNLERAQGFADTRTGFSSLRRPKEISLWIKCGRRKRIEVKGQAYKKSWLVWWDSLNPDWHPRNNGGLDIGGSGDWTSLLHPGINGFISAIVGLLAYHDVAEADEWELSARDVVWVIGQVLVVAQNASGTHGSSIAASSGGSNTTSADKHEGSQSQRKRAAEGGDRAPPHKRRR